VEISARQLDQAFLDKLSADLFVKIGAFEIIGRKFHLNIEYEGASEWASSVYAWVVVGSGGVVLRIGKCEDRLQKRLAQYKNSLEAVMSDRLRPNEYFKGDTKPWERELWLEFAGYPGAGMIFARSVPSQMLRAVERDLISRYNPLSCGDAPAGRFRRLAWIAKHGRPDPVSKRDRLSSFST
jgi:hypothetical protein